MLNDLLDAQEDDELSAELDSGVIGGPGVGYRIKPGASSADQETTSPPPRPVEKRKQITAGLTTSSKRLKKDFPVDISLDDDQNNDDDSGTLKYQRVAPRDSKSSPIDNHKISCEGRLSKSGEVSDDTSVDSERSHRHSRRRISRRLESKINNNDGNKHNLKSLEKNNYSGSSDDSCSCEEHSSLASVADSKSVSSESQTKSYRKSKHPSGVYLASQVIDKSKELHQYAKEPDRNNNKTSKSPERQSRNHRRRRRGERLITRSSSSPRIIPPPSHRDIRPQHDRRRHSPKRQYNVEPTKSYHTQNLRHNHQEYSSARASNHNTLLDDLLKDACFFQMKSCNYENIEISKSMGVWSTPLRNDAKLNQAFQEFRNVILVFSVKQSGKFQGFARISSESSQSLPIRWHLPSGFDETQLGGVFKLDWISAIELPFYKTSHLVNPLNENKPVKIARDGQELDPSVGEELCRMFEEDPSIDLVPIVRRMRRQLSGPRMSNPWSDSHSSQRFPSIVGRSNAFNTVPYGHYDRIPHGYSSHNNRNPSYQHSMGYGARYGQDDHSGPNNKSRTSGYANPDRLHYADARNQLSSRQTRDRRYVNQKSHEPNAH